MNIIPMSAALALVFVSSGSLADASRDKAIQNSLKQFEKNPLQFMQAIPMKWDTNGRVISKKQSLFPSKATRNKDYVLYKNRNRPLAGPFSTAPIGPNDKPEMLADQIQWRTLEEMEHAGKLEAFLSEQPWSGDYWPLYAGGTARRFADPTFPDSKDWKVNSDFLMSSPGHSSSNDVLSPAEKYDLLIGDPQRTLTRRSLNEGKMYFEEYGKVELWMGLCHGWAPAAFMASRPTHSVEALAADGKTLLRFYPDDIKALTSQLWANVRYKTQWTGSRCDKKEPSRDGNGRVIDEECFDDNPGTWHLAVVNQVGAARRSFVLDATFDYQVWNQPVYGYRYSYFNPQTRRPATTLNKAKVSVNDFTADKFRRYRSQNNHSIVGIAMDVTYMAENSPKPKLVSGIEDDRKITAQYLYDLELDEAGKIIGGEWYSNAHPDFLWAPAPDAQASTDQDYWLQQRHPNLSWGGQKPLPKEWAEAAAIASRNGQPLAKILDVLHLLSRVNL